MLRAIDRLRPNCMPDDFNHSTMFVVNHVITVYFGSEVSKLLSSLAVQNISMRFTLECFPGLIAKLSEPKTTIMVFVSGRAVLVGSKSETEALYVAQWMRNEFELYRAAYAPHISPRDIIFVRPHTANIVNSSCLPPEKCPVDLGVYAARNWTITSYTPKTFSGCTVLYKRGDGERAKIVAFEDGNFNVMGCSNQETAIRAAQFIVADLSNYKAEPRKTRYHIVDQRCAELAAAKIREAEANEVKPDVAQVKLGDNFLDENEQDFIDRLLGMDGVVINLD